MATRAAHEIVVDGVPVRVSSLDRVIYPNGFTKGDVIDYYRRVAPTLVPHLVGRPLTLKRYPEGVDGPFFYEKNCPRYKPEWVRTIDMPRVNGGVISYCSVSDAAGLVWLANIGALELHPLLGRAPQPQCPTAIVFDLDPGPPAGLLDAARVALRVREVLSEAGLTSLVKSSGKKGIHVWAPLAQNRSFDDTKRVARSLAQSLERAFPNDITSSMRKAERPGKTFIDWSQNDEHKSIVAPYSLRAAPTPTVSAPLRWSEVEQAVVDATPERLVFDPAAVLDRVARDGDLFARALGHD
ncbi:MAG: polymerase LigD, polymerase domain protein [Actinomycetia bacterium]|nr:polymerase LigD, polymerase domain protein [Actinomycetes bacterium]